MASVGAPDPETAAETADGVRRARPRDSPTTVARGSDGHADGASALDLPPVANWGIAAGGLLLLAVADPRFAGAAAALAFTLYLLGRGMGSAHRRDRAGAVPELCFALAITLCLAFFVFYRFPLSLPFLDFARRAGVAEWPNPFDGAPFAAPGLVAAFGLSVFVWHALSYIADLYRGDVTASRDPGETLAYLFFFPSLFAGPTLRYRDLYAPLATRQPSMAAVAYGVRRITIGVVKVLLIGRTLAVPAAAAFQAPPGELSATLAWAGLACFGLQVYYDLSGVADIALGLGRMLGFRLPENFDWPYAADSLDRFWSGWNMTLRTWSRTYLHVPPILFFVAVAAWYGAAPPLFAWGALQGGLVWLERTPRWAARLRRLPVAARHTYVLAAVTVGWILFRAETFTDAGLYVAGLAGLGGAPLPGTPSPVTAWTAVAFAVGAVGAAPLLRGIGRWTVTVDALATALQMIVTAAVMFVRTRLGGRRRP